MKAILCWTSRVLMVSVIMLLDILFSAFRPLIEKKQVWTATCQWLYSVVFHGSAGYCLGKCLDWIHGETFFTPRLPAVFSGLTCANMQCNFLPPRPFPGSCESKISQWEFWLSPRSGALSDWVIVEKNTFGTKQNLACLTSVAS